MNRNVSGYEPLKVLTGRESGDDDDDDDNDDDNGDRSQHTNGLKTTTVEAIFNGTIQNVCKL